MTTLDEKLVTEIEAARENNTLDQINLERALLIASGLETEEQVQEYIAKIDELDRQFRKHCEAQGMDGVTKVITINEFLQSGKEHRYTLDNFLLTNAIDSVLSENSEPIGNCVALTALYTIMAVRQGLNVSVITPPNHVLNRVRILSAAVDIENTVNAGFIKNVFQSKDVINDPEEKPAIYLAASMFNDRAKLARDKEMLKAANLYEKSARVFPINARFTISAILFEQCGDFVNALKNYTRAIELDPNSSGCFYFRGMIQKDLKNYTLALQDLSKANEIDPKTKLFYGKGKSPRDDWKYFNAIADYTQAIKIEPSSNLYWLRGTLRKKMGNAIQAEGDFTNAIAMDRWDELSYFDRASLHMQSGNVLGGVQDFVACFGISTGKLYRDMGRAIFYTTRGTLPM